MRVTRLGHSIRIRRGLFGGLLAFSLLGVPVHAAGPTTGATESILLSPASKHYELTAGEAAKDTIRVVNDGQSAFDFAVYARPYSVNDEAYVPDFTSKAQNADLYKWVSFTTTSFRLEPGQAVEVPYTIRVPRGAAPGGHYGVLFAETQPSGDVAAGSVVRKKRVGAIIYATVKGDVRLSGSSLGVTIPFFQFSSPLKVAERVKNTGNTDFAVTSSVEVADLFGGIKYAHRQQTNVLPGTTRRISNDWSDPSWIGLYKVTYDSSFLDTKHDTTGYVLLVPVWVYLLLAVLIGGRVAYALARRRSSK